MIMSLAVDDEQVIVLVEVADVAGMVPAVPGGLRRSPRVLVVAGHHQRAADHDLAPLAPVEQVPVVIHDRDGGEGGRP
jgi:hypothetical protein